MTPAKKSKSINKFAAKHNIFNQKIARIPNKFISPADAKQYTVEEILHQIKIGTSNEENISTARKYRKEDHNYKILEESSPQIIWSFLPNGNKFTGLVYANINGDAIKQFNYEEADLKYEIRNKLNSVIALWTAFDGKGLDMIVYVPSMRSEDDYRDAYLAIDQVLENETGLTLPKDKTCLNPSRLNTLSLDSNIYINSNPKPFKYKKVNLQLPANDLLEYDEKLKYDALFSTIYRLDNYYTSHIISDKDTKLPIKFDPGFIFNPNIHKISRYIPEDVISKIPYKNSNSTVGYFPDGVCAVQVRTYSKMKIRRPEQDSLFHNILIKYLLIRNEYEPTLTKNELYNMALSLNKKCMNMNGNLPLPFLDEELNQITSQIWKQHENNELTFSIEKRTGIYSFNFHKKNKKEFTKVLLKELNQLRNGLLHNKREKIIHETFSYFENLGNEYTIKQVVFHLMKLINRKRGTIENMVYGALKIENPPPSTLCTSTSIKGQNVEIAGEKIRAAIDKLMELGIPIRQTEVSLMTGIPIRTLQSKWKSFKALQQRFNKKILGKKK